jgi:hypothetical protein
MFEMTIATNDVTVLQSKTPSMNVLPMGELAMYSVYVTSPAVLLISAVSCVGKVNVYANRNPSVLMKGIYTYEIPHHLTRNALGTIPVEQPGSLYLGVRTIHGEALDSLR